MKKICLVAFFFPAFLFVSGQAGEWVWIHGTNTTNGVAVYGTQGIPGPNNVPAATYEPCEWTDRNGNFWMYGGASSSNLWQYNPGTNEWTWMGAGTTSYGVMGVPSATNYPPSKSYGAGTWVDLNGDFWMFGGYPAYNDLWKYSPSANEWVWMKGSNTTGQAGIYGTKGIPDPANTPGARYECAATWTDNAGDLWLFGGYANPGMLNDLWRYNIASNQWTWMKGSALKDVTGTYGIQGVEDTVNTPCSRQTFSRWKDNCGDLWLFGGFDYTNKITYNDLWRYHIQTNSWTWMSGSNTGNAQGKYNSKCAVNSTNVPRARYENRTCWTDKRGNFWFFGGGNYAAANRYNDLWMYCVASNQWIWQSGDSTSNPAGNWGIKGVSSPTNKPSGRFGAVGWMDNNDHLYMFGANLNMQYNDLWKYTIDTACGNCAPVTCSLVLPQADFMSDDSALCVNECINFTDLSIHATSWQWFFPGATPASSAAQNPYICYQAPGMYDIKLVVSNSGGKDSVTLINYIHVMAAPLTPVISLSGTTLYCSTDPSYTSYQWYDSTTLIPGATDTALVITHDGNYNVQVSNADSCRIAVGINVVLGTEQFAVYGLPFTVSPNPVSDMLSIEGTWKTEDGNRRLTIFNLLGEIIYIEEIKPAQKRKTINCKSFPPGIYFVQLSGEKKRWVAKFIKE